MSRRNRTDAHGFAIELRRRRLVEIRGAQVKRRTVCDKRWTRISENYPSFAKNILKTLKSLAFHCAQHFDGKSWFRGSFHRGQLDRQFRVWFRNVTNPYD